MLGDIPLLLLLFFPLHIPLAIAIVHRGFSFYIAGFRDFEGPKGARGALDASDH